MTCKVEQLAKPARFKKPCRSEDKTERMTAQRLRNKTYKVGKTLQVR
tara:strand:- start:89 stop:229 length:141 start_codon:yes stop_codon:yes gene_type:complete